MTDQSTTRQWRESVSLLLREINHSDAVPDGIEIHGPDGDTLDLPRHWTIHYVTFLHRAMCAAGYDPCSPVRVGLIAFAPRVYADELLKPFDGGAA